MSCSRGAVCSVPYMSVRILASRWGVRRGTVEVLRHVAKFGAGVAVWNRAAAARMAQRIGSSFPMDYALEQRLEVFVRGESDETALIEELCAACTATPDLAWDVLAISDQYHRRGKVSADLNRTIRHAIERPALALQAPELLNAMSITPIAPLVRTRLPAASVSSLDVGLQDEMRALRRELDASRISSPVWSAWPIRGSGSRACQSHRGLHRSQRRGTSPSNTMESPLANCGIDRAAAHHDSLACVAGAPCGGDTECVRGPRRRRGPNPSGRPTAPHSRPRAIGRRAARHARVAPRPAFDAGMSTDQVNEAGARAR